MILDSRILWSLLKTQTVTVSVTRQPSQAFLLFQVSQIADLGRSGQRVFMKPVGNQEQTQPHSRISMKKTPPALPLKIAHLNVTYAGAPCMAVQDPYEAIVDARGTACIEKIVPEVLAPGDYVLLRKGSDGQVRFVEALRAMTVRHMMNCKPAGIAHAL